MFQPHKSRHFQSDVFFGVVAVCWFVGCCLFLLLFRMFGFGLVVVVLGWMG